MSEGKLILSLLKKDTQIFASHIQAVVQSVLLGLVLIFVLSLGLERPNIEMASVIFWFASCFALMVSLGDLYRHDTTRIREELKRSSIIIQWIWFSKTLVGMIFFVATQIILLAAITIFLNLEPKGSFLKFSLITICIDIGMVSIASLLGSSPKEGSIKSDSLLSVILFPIQIPLIMAGIKSSVAFLHGEGEILSWLEFVFGCDVIFIAIALILFPYIYYP